MVALLAGGSAGLVTALLNTHLKITDLLSGILVAFMLYSINLKVMGGVLNLALINHPNIFNNINPVLMLLCICFIIWLIISYILSTDFGLAIRSIGQNKRFALNGGMNVKQMTIITLMLSNSLIALGGALFAEISGFADIGSGTGTVIIGFAVVMIGERILPFKSVWFGSLACLLGSIIYKIFVSLALHSEVIGLETQDLNLITGFMVIIIMLLPRRKSC